MSNLLNTSMLHGAAVDFRKAGALAQSGTARAVLGLADTLDRPMIIRVGDDTFSFVVGDYAFPPMGEDGKIDSVLRRAQLDYICVELAGEKANDINDAVKAGIRKAYPGAVYLHKTGLKLTLKGGHIASVPIALAVDIFDDKGELNTRGKKAATAVRKMAELEGRELTDEQVIAKINDYKLVCDGSDHPAFGKLPTSTQLVKRMHALAIANGWMPPIKSKDRDSAATPETLSRSIKMTNRVVTEWMESDETDVPPSPELAKSLHNLGERIAAYFISNPLVK